MVNITNGKSIISVANGVFKEVYQKQGWKLVNEKPVKEEVNIVPNDEFEQTLDEKPLREMSLEELKEYAKMNNVNVDGLDEKKEIRKAIKEALND